LRKNWIDVTAKVMERLVPDAITTSILLLIVLFITSVSLGNTVTATMEAYYKGLWMLLAFTMQMTLVLVLSLILGATPAFRKMIIYLSRIPRTSFQVVTIAVLTCSVIAYLNWGLSQALGPLIAIHFCKEAELKGIKVDFLFMLATLAGAGSIWQFGLSASAPLLMATPGHFLEQTTGIMSLRSTIWAPASIILIIVFIFAVIAAGYLMMPKKVRLISEFPESNKIAEAAITSSDPEKDEPTENDPAKRAAKMEKPPMLALTMSQKLEVNPLVSAILCLALAGWLYMHFFIKHLSLDINALNTIFLLACLIFHRNVARFTKALQEVVGAAWPIIVMYHLYAGVAGLIQFTPVGETLAGLMNPISTQYSYPFLTALISTVVAVFIPTSGGQWLIQGLITVKAAEAVGLTAQRGLLALSIGDHMGNLISPFWAVVGASIARIDFRLYFGYRLIFAAIWFVLGVLAFTFLPC
jgi:short-chain fatty acids transporter